VNYLAHCFLSGQNDDILFGNFVADGLKRTKTTLFTPMMLKGIELHRFIDHFTDTHPLVKQSVRILREDQGKFSPVVIDMVFDHFLAMNWHLYSHESLEVYSKKTYKRLDAYLPFMPPNVLRMFDHMKEHNWFISYKEEKGMRQALTGLSKRTRFPSAMDTAWKEIKMHYDELNAHFLAFFPELQWACSSLLTEIISDSESS